MTAPSKLSDDVLRAYLESGHSQADAARHSGVSEPAIHQRLKRMRYFISRVIALERANDIVEEKLSATAPSSACSGSSTRNSGGRCRKQAKKAVIVRLADVILKLAGEVRQQLGLQLAIARTLVDLRVVKEFQETVVEAIREESPGTARRIVARLKERRALRPTAELPTLAGGPDAGLA
jgi:hypothetical protein